MTEPAAPASGTPAAPAPAAPAAPAPAAPTPEPAAPAAPSEPSGEKPWWDGKITEPEIVDYMKAKNYATPEEAARAAWSANKMMKMEPNVQAVLEGKATPEQEAAFYNQMGRPPSPDKYEFKHGEGVTVDADLEKLGREIFHKAGVPQGKAQELLDLWNKGVADKIGGNAVASQQENETALADLAKTWGADLDKNKAAGDRVMRSLGIDAKFMEKIEGAIGSAAVVELLARIGRKTDEGSFKGGNENPPGDPNNPDTMNAQQAQARIDALNSDAEFQKKYTDKTNPGHTEALALMERLFAKAVVKAK